MHEDPKAGKVTVSFEELAYTNMIVVESLVQLLIEKGVVSRQEMQEKVKKVKLETKVNYRPQS